MTPTTQGFAAMPEKEIVAGLRHLSGRHGHWITTDMLGRQFERERGVPSNLGSLAGRLADLASKGAISASEDLAGARKWRAKPG